jgi:hypothetical protein
MCNFIFTIQKLNSHGHTRHVERPSLSIFSEIFEFQDVKCPYLVLDEVTAVNNTDSLTFAAIKELRRMAHTCVMVTSSPVNNRFLVGEFLSTEKMTAN